MTTERTTFSTRRFLVGKAGPFPRLVFREEVMLALDQFSHLHSQGEHGGFLIGRNKQLKTAEQYEIIVERFVPIPQRSDATRLVIRPDHYRTVELALKQNEEIVGWAHTHPGFGVFLSDFDKEQHQRYFPSPWQIAYVMDNQAHERAVYRVADDEWERLGGYYVLRDLADNEVGITVGRRKGRRHRLIAALLAVLLLAAGAAVGYPIVREMLVSREPAEQIATVTEQESVQSVPGKEELSAEPTDALGAEAVPEPAEAQPETGAVTIAPPSTVPRYVEYVVQSGDTLWSIAGKLWGDPSLFRIIAEENGITSPASIRVGSILRVPADPPNR
ncbi:MAG: LysM peptidoglycan-binding domain-containing protein [Limnochordia bacterium]|jgi:proteasome lid subunit RPN8/RPN11